MFTNSLSTQLSKLSLSFIAPKRVASLRYIIKINNKAISAKEYSSPKHSPHKVDDSS